MFSKLKLSIISIAAAISLLAGCIIIIEWDELTEAGDIYLATYKTPVNNEGVNITMANLATLMDTDSDGIYIMDWRASSAFNSFHLVGAQNFAANDLDDLITNNQLPLDKTIINVCYSGQTASVVTGIMNILAQDPNFAGLEAKNLKFGMCGVDNNTASWLNNVNSDSVGALVTGASSPTTSQGELDLDTGEKTLAGIIAARTDYVFADWNITAATVIADPSSYFIINYWPADQYADPGHIDGSHQFTPKVDLLTTGKLTHLPTDGTEVVVYCYTGQTSAQMVAYLRMLGYDAKSLLFGIEGFAHSENPGTTFSAPAVDYSSYVVTGP